MLANIGIPLIHLHVGFAVLCLAPVVVVEARIYRRRLATGRGRSLAASLLANLATTLVGVPIAWLGAALILGSFGSETGSSSPVLMGLRYAPWLPPLDPARDTALYQVYPAAVATLLRPSLCLSILLERPVVRAVLRAERAAAGRAVRSANLVSYALLFALSLAWLAYTQLAPVGLAPADARALRSHVTDKAWTACVAPEVPARTRLANRAWFGPPAYALLVHGVTDADQQACLTAAVGAWLTQRGAGPLTLEFHTEVAWVQVDELKRRATSSVLAREHLDGRD